MSRLHGKSVTLLIHVFVDKPSRKRYEVAYLLV
jgi:hypothetical protein